MEWLEEVLLESTAAKPTQFDIFCQKKLEEFRECVRKQIKSSDPLKPKLQKLVDMIINLHAPGCRGNISKLYFTSFHHDR